MKGKQYSEAEILEVLGKVEAGQHIEDVARSSGVAKTTIHRWQAKYVVAGRGGPPVRV